MRSWDDRGRPSTRAGHARASQTPRVTVTAPLLSQTRRRIILAMLAMGLAGTCLTALLASPLVAVRHVLVRGLASLTPEEATEIKVRAMLAPNTHLFRAPATEIAGALRQLPFVAG